MSSGSWSDFSSKVRSKSKVTGEKEDEVEGKSSSKLNSSNSSSFSDLKASLKKSSKHDKEELLGKREKVREEDKNDDIMLSFSLTNKCLVYN